MGWKSINGGQYYYRSERVNGRVVSSYVGTGSMAVFEDLAARAKRIERNAQRLAETRRRADNRELDDILDRMAGDAKRDATAFLNSLGYHEHKRMWRRQRMAQLATQPGTLATNSQGGQLAEWPNKAIEPRLLDRVAINVLAARIAGRSDDSALVEDIEAQAADFAGDNPSAIENSLAQTAALAWGALRAAELTQDLKGAAMANRRYLAVLRTLAHVRKLAGPSVLILSQKTTVR